MKHHYSNTRPSHIPYCFPSTLPSKGMRATFAQTLPIRSDFSFTLWKEWRGCNPRNEILFDAWGSLDALVCHRFLRLGNNWRMHPKRPKWIVVVEKKPDGNKHLHGTIECLPAISESQYASAFTIAYYKCHKMRGFVQKIEETESEIKWKTYITKYQELEGRQKSFTMDRDPQSDTYEFDVRFSPNFPCWKTTEL